MRGLTRTPRTLLATDFSEALFEEFGFHPEIRHGGWVVDRTAYRQDELIQDIRDFDADVLVVEEDKVQGEVFEACPNLLVVASMRANPVNVDLEAAQENGVVVLHAPGRNAQSVAEFSLYLMLDTLRNATRGFLEMRAGRWGTGKDDPYLKFRGFELTGKTVGLLGLGAIGQRLAALLAPFHGRVLAFDPFQSEETFRNLSVEPVSLEQLLAESEILSIHVPINSHTRGMLGEKELQSMKRSAILINTARAAVVDHDALVRALKEGWIAGVGLDTPYEEPPDMGDPLFHFDNVFFTPHLGGATYEVISHGSKMVLEDLDRILNNQKPEYAAVFPEQARVFRK